jgi:hypothetical protein
MISYGNHYLRPTARLSAAEVGRPLPTTAKQSIHKFEADQSTIGHWSMMNYMPIR